MDMLKIELHDWNILGWLFARDRVLVKLGFADQFKVLVFEGVTRMWLDGLMAQNIVEDLVQLTPADPQFDAFVRKLDQSLASLHSIPDEDTKIYALRASVGLDGVVACRHVREASPEEWIQIASDAG